MAKGERGLIIHKEWADILHPLPPEHRHMIMDALLEYFLTGEKVKFDNDPIASALLSMFYVRMDNDRENYEAPNKQRSESMKEYHRKKKEKEQVDHSTLKSTIVDHSTLKSTDNTNTITTTTTNTNTNAMTIANTTDDVHIILSQHPTIVEAIQRKYKLTKEEIRDWGNQFNDHCRIALTTHKDDKDHLAHFRDWLNIQINESKKHDTINNNTSRQQRAEGAAGLVAEFLAECDEVRNERELPTDF